MRTLCLFLILGGKLSLLPESMELAVGFSWIPFITLVKFFTDFSFFSVFFFYYEMVLYVVKYFFCIYWHDHVFLFFIQLTWCNNLLHFGMLKKLWILGINQFLYVARFRLLVFSWGLLSWEILVFSFLMFLCHSNTSLRVEKLVLILQMFGKIHQLSHLILDFFLFFF